MKKVTAWTCVLFLFATALASSCRRSVPQESQREESVGGNVQKRVSEVQQMGVYDYTDTFASAGHSYVYTIHREPDLTLPTVHDEMGYEFADNVYTLNVTRDGKPLINRTLRKSDFASYLSADIRRGGILDGLIYDASQSGLNFAACVSLPQSDMSQPFILSFDEHGNMAIERDVRAEIEDE